jgi:DNA adenine methylase
MILTRQGNKTKLAETIINFFPVHDVYIEPFFGAGGVFFNKRKAAHNILNDIDSDVFNLFQVISNTPRELESEFLKIPIHSDLLKYWQKNRETDPVKKALRFLLLSNFTFLGFSKNNF